MTKNVLLLVLVAAGVDLCLAMTETESHRRKLNQLLKTKDEELEDQRLLLSDPMSAALFTSTFTTVRQYATGSGCDWNSFGGCEYFSLNIINHFCSVELQHIEHYVQGEMRGDVPADVIYGGSKNVGGRFYGDSNTKGLQRYSANVNGNTYYLDIFWCMDCGISSGYMGSFDRTDFGMAIQRTSGRTVRQSYDCFYARFRARHMPTYWSSSVPSDCYSNYYAFGLFGGGSSTYQQVEYNDGSVGIKLRGMMEESKTHVTNVNVYPLNGQQSTTCSS